MYLSLKTTLNDRTDDWTVFCWWLISPTGNNLTCSLAWLQKIFPDTSPCVAHGLTALKWRMRCWEPSLWPFHHAVTGMMFVEVSSHFTPSPSLCVQRSPGQGTTSFPLSPALHNSLKTPKSLYRSGVHLCAMYGEETVGSYSNQWQLYQPEMGN